MHTRLEDGYSYSVLIGQILGVITQLSPSFWPAHMASVLCWGHHHYYTEDLFFSFCSHAQEVYGKANLLVYGDLFKRLFRPKTTSFQKPVLTL